MAFLPLYNAGPLTFIARNLLAFIDENQDEVFAFYNTYWSTIIDHTLLRINPLSMFVGTPLEAKDIHARALYAVPSGQITEQDNTDDQASTIRLLYLTGPVSFAGTSDAAHAQQAASVEVSGYYLTALDAMIAKRMTSEALTANWPITPEINGEWPDPPSIDWRRSIQQVNAREIGAAAELGVQMVLTLDLKIGAHPFRNQRANP